MASQSEGRARGSRLLLLAALVVFALSFGLAFRFATRPSRELARWVERELGVFLAPRVHVGEARFDARTLSILLSDLRIGDDPEAPDIAIDRVRVETSVSLDEGVRITRVVLWRPAVRALSLGNVLGASPPETGDATPLPIVEIRDATVRFTSPGLGTLEFAEMHASAVPTGGGDVRISGVALTPFQGSLRVTGSVNVRSGQVEIRGSTETDVDVAQPVRSNFDPAIQDWIRQLAPVGKIAMQVRIVRESAEQPLRFEGSIEGSGLAATIPRIDVRPTDLKLRATLSGDGHVRWEASGRVLGGAGLSSVGDAIFDPETAELLALQAGARVRELILGPEVHRVLQELDRGTAEVYAGLGPEGPVDLLLFVSRSGRDGPVDLGAELDLRQGAVTFHGFPGADDEIDESFPYRVTDVEGRISIRPGRVAIGGVRGQMGTGRIRVAGEVWGSGRVGLDVGIQAESVPIDAAVSDAVQGLSDGAAGWKLFDLRGKLDFDVRATRPEGRMRADVMVRVGSMGTVSGSFREFPVPVESLSGAAVFDQGLVTFGFDGTSRSGSVRIDGLVDGAADASGREPASNGIRLIVSAKKFGLDDTFGAYLGSTMPSLRAFLDDLSPRSQVEFEYRGERPREGPTRELSSVVSIQAERGVVQRVPGVEVALEDASASFRVRSVPREGHDPDLDVVLDSIRARHRGDPIRVVGSFETRAPEGSAPPPGAPPIARRERLDLVVAGIDLSLGDQLIAPMAAGSSPGAREMLERYRFGGSFDFFLERHSTNDSKSMDVDIELRQAAVSGPGIPGTFDQVRGRVRVDENGRVDAPSLQGRLDGVPVLLERFALLPAEKGEPVHVEGVLTSVESMDLAESISKTHPEARKWMEGLAFDAQVEPKEFAWSLDVADVGLPVFRARGSMVLRNGWALPGPILTRIEGLADIEDLVFDEAGFRMRARLGATRLSALGFPATNLSGLVELSPTRIRISELAGTVAEGTIRSRLSDVPFLDLSLADPVPSWSLSIDLAKANLQQLMARANVGPGDVRGQLDLALSLRGKGADHRGYGGEGRVRVANASLFDVPGFKPLYDRLDLKKKPSFRELLGIFRVRDGLVDFDPLDLVSDPLSLLGAGRIRFDGRLELGFKPRLHDVLNPAEWFLIGPVLTFLQDRVIEVFVFGDLWNPQYTIDTPLSSRRRSQLRKRVIAPEPPVELGERF